MISPSLEEWIGSVDDPFRERRLTSVEIEEVAIVLYLDVCHLLAPSHRERESAGIWRRQPRQEWSVEAALQQELLSLDAGDRLMKPPGRREEDY